jgi:hypothetical protein
MAKTKRKTIKTIGDDQIGIARVNISPNLSDKQKEILRKYAKDNDMGVREMTEEPVTIASIVAEAKKNTKKK